MANINTSNNVFDKINAANNSGAKVKSQAEEDSQMFMKLMIAQLQNQDPTNPADTSDFMQQIASMSQVEGIANLTATVEDMQTSLMQSQSALQASAMVGKTAFINGNEVYVEAGKDGRAMLELDTATNNVMVEIRDSNGELVSTSNMGNLIAGNYPLTLGNDQFPEGSYTFNVYSTDGDVRKSIPTYVGVGVNSVTLGQNGIGLKVNTTSGSFNLEDIRQIG